MSSSRAFRGRDATRGVGGEARLCDGLAGPGTELDELLELTGQILTPAVIRYLRSRWRADPSRAGRPAASVSSICDFPEISAHCAVLSALSPAFLAHSMTARVVFCF